MKYSFELKLGDRTLRIEDEAEDERAFIRAMSFWDTIPQCGPGGEADLEFCFRSGKAKNGKPYTYYSIVCPSAQMEFIFGQHLENVEGNKLFPRDGGKWTPLQLTRYRQDEPLEQPEREPEQERKPVHPVGSPNPPSSPLSVAVAVATPSDFWPAARGLKAGGLRAFSDQVIKDRLKKFSDDQGATDWNACYQSLVRDVMGRAA